MTTVSNKPAPAKPTGSTPAADSPPAPGQPMTVKKGDNLTRIAERALGTKDPATVNAYVSRIAQENGIKDPNKINAGQQLNLPAVATPAPAATPPAPAAATPAAAPSVATPASKAQAEGKAAAAGTQPKSDTEVKWAQDFTKSADEKMTKAGVPKDQRDRITAHLGTLQGPALAAECKVLDHALKSPNADRAVGTYDKTLTMSKESPRAAERLTPDVREALVNGVADRRTKADIGVGGVLGQQQAEQAARAMVDMPAEQYGKLKGALNAAGNGPGGQGTVKGSDPGAEKSLILKAVAARADRLKESPLDVEAQKAGQCRVTPADTAMGEVTAFAGDVRGMPRDELMRTTTARAVGLASPGEVPGNSRAAATDRGLYQKWEDSCGPTTAQMMKADADPAYARSLHKNGLGTMDPNSPVALEQKKELERPIFFDSTGKAVQRSAAQEKTVTDAQAANPGRPVFLDTAGKVITTTPTQEKDWTDHPGNMPKGATGALPGGNAVARLGTETVKNLTGQLNTLQKQGKVTGEQRDLMVKELQGGTLTPAERVKYDKAIDTVRKADHGHPTNLELEAVRTLNKTSAGTVAENPLNHMVSDVTHHSYDRVDGGKVDKAGKPEGGLQPGHLADIDQRLKNGQDVGIRATSSPPGGPSHFMMISDVRGEGKDKRYLVSDPFSGKTAWLSESDLTSPKAQAFSKTFGLSQTTVDTYYKQQ